MLMQIHKTRLSDLRKELQRRDLDGFVIPISDEHMSEYIGAYAQRLAWLTGFGGSAGSAIVLCEAGSNASGSNASGQDESGQDESGQDESGARDSAQGAAIFIDGRYTVQVAEQVDGSLYEYAAIPATNHAKWLSLNAGEGAQIGFDPWLHSEAWAQKVAAALEEKGGALIPVESNPVDAVWRDRPAVSDAPAMVHADLYAGKSSAQKRSEVADWLKQEGLDTAVISALDSIAWLLNIRGNDVERTPVALSYLLAHADGTAELFIAPEKVTPELEQHLGNAVTIRARDDFAAALKQLGQNEGKNAGEGAGQNAGQGGGKTIAVDPDFGVAGIHYALKEGGAKVVSLRDPVILPKAVKNPAEQQGHRDAQTRDGAAVTKFLYWLAVEACKGGESELSAAAQLAQFRGDTGLLKDQSFDTISAAGPHAAIPHYRVDEESNLPIDPGSVFLCDSGGQYLDGTTDITRTVWIAGSGDKALPNDEVRDRFTRVLKGHIQIARAIFPQGTNGSQLDVLARQYLWEAGVDYAHGTGHGVGSYLGVHEGPQRIAKSSGGQAGTDQELIAGMILSNEPGYYKAGDFGIRIENLVLVEPREITGAEGAYLGFENLTWVPMAREMVDQDMLTPEERQWWNDYHTQVEEILSPLLEGEVLAWLQAACAPI